MRATQHFDLGWAGALGAARPVQVTEAPTSDRGCGHPRGIKTARKPTDRTIKKDRKDPAQREKLSRTR